MKRPKLLTRNFPFLIALFAMSCSAPVEIPPLVCPPPPVPVCSPGTFNQTLLDTVFHLGQVQSHITMLPVPPNSMAQDYAIAFIPSAGGTIALITSNRSCASDDSGAPGTQGLFSAQFLGTTRFGPLNAVNTGDAPLPLVPHFIRRPMASFIFLRKRIMTIRTITIFIPHKYKSVAMSLRSRTRARSQPSTRKEISTASPRSIPQAHNFIS